MKKKSICVISGDGIGPEVMEVSLQVIKALKLNFEIKREAAGYSAWQKSGDSLPAHTLRTCNNCDAVLFGAVTTPPHIKNYLSPIIRLRKELDLYANIRPFFSLPINNTVQGLDFVIVRENSQGLYSGIEKRITDGYMALRIITRKASARIIRQAFLQALKRRRKVVVVHKANVLRLTDGLFLKQARQISAEYKDVDYFEMLVDNCAFQLIKNPKQFDVIVTTNMFGDILSDEAAGLVGGLGVVASANIGPKHALFEPVHGSAPKYVGQNKVNPIAMLSAVGMMLEYLSITKKANLLKKVIISALKNGIVTYDLGGKYKTSDVVEYIIKQINLLTI